jgi:hypothetical protein
MVTLVSTMTGWRFIYDPKCRLDLRRFAPDGVVLLGRLRDIEDGTIALWPDLPDHLAEADQFETRRLRRLANTSSTIKHQGIPRLPPICRNYAMAIMGLPFFAWIRQSTRSPV